jgi:hypothetical protein
MPSTYTSLLRLTLPADGELIGTWGQVVNNGITTLEESSIAGTSNIAMTDANRTLTTANGATDEARTMVIAFTGTLTAQRDIIVPTSSKIYFVRNATSGGFGLNVKTSAGTGVVVPNGTSMLVYCNGTNVVTAITSLVGTGQFLADLGSAAAPSYSFLTDPNTGLYGNGADSIGISTNGTSRAVFDGNGQLLIAVPTNAGAPNISMTVAAGGFGIDMRGRSSDNLSVMRWLNNAGSTQGATAQWDNANGFVIGSTGATIMQFMTGGTARMNIDTSGNVRVTGPLMAAPNFWVAETAAGAGTVGVSGGLGAAAVFWGTSSGGGGAMDLTASGNRQVQIQQPGAGAITNFHVLSGGQTGVRCQFIAAGTDTNIGYQWATKGSGDYAFFGNGGVHLQINCPNAANKWVTMNGAVSANPVISSNSTGIDFQVPPSVSAAGRPWTGSVAASQGYVYNVALGLCNMTATANNRIHEWYKDATALYGLWISDNGGAAAQWIKVTGGQAAGNSAIDIGPSVGVNFSVTTGGVNITGSATSNGSLTLTDTGAAGANFKMTGNGATTPSKFLRVSGGAFEVISSAYTASLFGVHEDGTLTDIRALQIVRDPGATSANIPIGGIIGGQGAGMSTVKALDSVTLSGSVTITQTGFGGSLPALTTGTYRLITFTGGTNAVFMRIG